MDNKTNIRNEKNIEKIKNDDKNSKHLKKEISIDDLLMNYSD